MTIENEVKEFADFLQGWLESLNSLQLKEVINDPLKTAIISVDVTNGFCYTGALASSRVAGIVTPITKLFNDLHKMGIKHFLLVQDTHEPDAVEFAQWPPHCVRGTEECETVAEIKNLSFFSEFQVFPKNSIESVLNSGLNSWLTQHGEVDTFFVVGDCTDLCTYQLAMALRLEANARQMQRRVFVPANCVQTYDLPTSTALQSHLPPHPGDLLHAVFLYHMALNGVEVVQNLE